MERDQLSREKQLREEAEKEKDELQQRMHELQEQFQGVQEAVVCPLTVLCLDTWI